MKLKQQNLLFPNTGKFKSLFNAPKFD